MSADTYWGPKEVMEGKGIKSATEHNGVYAFKTLKDFLNAKTSLPVYGKISMWGTVIEHELGYRAEYARVVSIENVVDGAFKKFLPELRERYGVAA